MHRDFAAEPINLTVYRGKFSAEQGNPVADTWRMAAKPGRRLVEQRDSPARQGNFTLDQRNFAEDQWRSAADQRNSPRSKRITQIHIRHFTHRAAVNAHPHLKLRMGLEGLRQLQRTVSRFVRSIAEDQSYPIARREPDELFVRRFPHLRRRHDQISQLLKALVLLFDQELGVTHDIDKENMSDLELKIFFPIQQP